MNVVAFTGYSGAGKTTLLEGVIAALRAHGCSVAVVKHAHHGFDVDRPGKDSWRHREAGATEVLIASARRIALLRELPPPPTRGEAEPPPLADLLALLDPSTDWVLLEGFRGAGAVPKVEVWRAAAQGEPPRAAHYPHDASICAVATDHPGALPVPAAVPVLDLNAPAAVAAWLLEHGAAFAWPDAAPALSEPAAPTIAP